MLATHDVHYSVAHQNDSVSSLKYCMHPRDMRIIMEALIGQCM